MLGLLLKDDPGTDGYRVLVPFLTSNDLLRLSRCCHAMKSYRQLLQDFTIRYRGTMTAYKKRQLDHILSELKCPRSFVVSDARVFPMVFRHMESTTYQQHVEGVSLAPPLRPDESTTEQIGRAVDHHVFQNVQWLCFYNMDLSNIIGRLSSATCPHLKGLCVDRCHVEDPIYLGTAVANCRHLQRLILRDSTCPYHPHYSLLTCTMLALKIHDFSPKLRELRMVGLWTLELDPLWMAESISMGAFSELQTLEINDCSMGSVGTSAIVNALGTQTSPNITNLYLQTRRVDLGIEFVEAVTQIVFEKRLPMMKRLSIPFYDDKMIQMALALYPALRLSIS